MKLTAFLLVAILIAGAVVQLMNAVVIKELDIDTLLSPNAMTSNSRYYWESQMVLDRVYSKLKGSNYEPGDPGYIYYISDGTNTYTNSEGYLKKDFIDNSAYYFTLEDGETSTFGPGWQNTVTYYEGIILNGVWEENDAEEVIEDLTITAEDPVSEDESKVKEDITIYLGYTKEAAEQRQEEWNKERAQVLYHAKYFTGFTLGALALIIYLIAVTGRNPEDEEVHLIWIDRIYTEFSSLLFIPIVLLGAFIIIEVTESMIYSELTMMSAEAFLYLILVASAVTAGLCGVILLSLVRKIKARQFIKGSITYKIFYAIFDFFRSFFDGRRLKKYPLTKTLKTRQIIFIVSSFVLVGMTFLFILFPPLMILSIAMEIVLIYWYVKYNDQTYDEINKGFNESLEEQMKAERMKINLVTNVSHDLKTPLTSIISYVDLLSKEELSEISRDYVNILAEKSNRLKSIVADLFDLAKSTSGDINLDLESLDMKKLIEQTLGDMEDNIEKSGLQVRVRLPETPVTIRSDGKKLYRVFQNVIDNALKYSLEGTRIYVDLIEEDGRAIATVKNTSSYEMDFTSDEILQRFNRGDKSRTTEGSGLGLSIAESFTEVSGGRFGVEVDGDMFKVIIIFNIV